MRNKVEKVNAKNPVYILLLGVFFTIALIVYISMGYKTAEIHGKVVNAITGELINDGIAYVGWSRAGFDNTIPVRAEAFPIKDGQFIIPSKRVSTKYLVSSFYGVVITVLHKDYLKEGVHYYRWENKNIVTAKSIDSFVKLTPIEKGINPKNYSLYYNIPIEYLEIALRFNFINAKGAWEIASEWIGKIEQSNINEVTKISDINEIKEKTRMYVERYK